MTKEIAPSKTKDSQPLVVALQAKPFSADAAVVFTFSKSKYVVLRKIAYYLLLNFRHA